MGLGDLLPDELGFVFGIPLLVAAILILVAGRRDDDNTGVRTQARYVGVISIVALFITLFAVFGVARGLTDLIADKGDSVVGERTIFGLNIDDGDLNLKDLLGSDAPDNLLSGGPGGLGDDGGFLSDEPVGSDNDDYRLVIGSALLALAAGAVFVFHRRHARKLEAKRGFRAGVGGRVERAFVLGVCFVAALIVIVGATRGLYGLFRIMVPGVTGEGAHDIERKLGIAQFLSYLVLVSGALWIFFTAWRSSARGD